MRFRLRWQHWLLISLMVLGLALGISLLVRPYLEPKDSTFAFLKDLEPRADAGNLIEATGMTTTGWTQSFQFRQNPSDVLRFIELRLVASGQWVEKVGGSGQVSFRKTSDPKNVFLLFDNGRDADYAEGFHCRVLTNRPASKRELAIGL